MKPEGVRRRILSTALDNKLQDRGSASHSKCLTVKPKQREEVVAVDAGKYVGLEGVPPIQHPLLQSNRATKTRSPRLEGRLALEGKR